MYLKYYMHHVIKTHINLHLLLHHNTACFSVVHVLVPATSAPRPAHYSLFDLHLVVFCLLLQHFLVSWCFLKLHAFDLSGQL